MYHTTGFDREEVIDLCIRINSVSREPEAMRWPPCLGLFRSVAATLTYMRHNRTQSEIGESLGVSQPTVSRAISAITPLIPEAVRDFVPTADDLDPDAQYILDGTLLPCWSWDGHKGDYSFIAFWISPLRNSGSRRDGKFSTIPQAKMNVS